MAKAKHATWWWGKSTPPTKQATEKDILSFLDGCFDRDMEVVFDRHGVAHKIFITVELVPAKDQKAYTDPREECDACAGNGVAGGITCTACDGTGRMK